MPRLSDADALMRAIKDFRWFGVPNTLKLMFDYLRIIIKEQPTVDAVEVVHGRWLPVEDCLFPCTKEKCSLCGIRKGTGYVYHYCPNCGAKMDGERKDND